MGRSLCPLSHNHARVTVYKPLGTRCVLIVTADNFGSLVTRVCPMFSFCLDNLLLFHLITDMCFQPGCHAVVSG